ncbi:MAG: hypothetical protein ACYDHO_08265, partial [Gaiellaceae bacterium]
MSTLMNANKPDHDPESDLIPGNGEEDSGSRVALSIRLPASLHGEFKRLAVREGVTLNHLITYVLSMHVGASGKVKFPANVPDEHELRSAIRVSEASCRTAIGLIRYFEENGATNLGLLLRALVADRILTIEGAHEA